MKKTKKQKTIRQEHCDKKKTTRENKKKKRKEKEKEYEKDFNQPNTSDKISDFADFTASIFFICLEATSFQNMAWAMCVCVFEER